MTYFEGADDIASVARRVSLTRQSAVLCAEVTGDVGYLFFLEGKLVHASSLDLEGDAAAVEILHWHAPNLSWCERRWPRQHSITKDLGELLLQAPAPLSEPFSLSEPAPAAVPDAFEVELEPPPESGPRRPAPAVAVAFEPRFPTVAGVSRVLLAGGFKNALSLNGNGRVEEAHGRHEHLRSVVQATPPLGDLLGAALGVGPLVAAEACGAGFHRLVARSTDGVVAAETSGGDALLLARAFLKL